MLSCVLASPSLALAFVNALRFISSISWHCLDSQEAFSQIKWADSLITLGRVEATNPRDTDSLREVFLWSPCDNNRLWDGIQSESSLMILIQAATSDKAPVLRAALSSPQCNNLLSAYSKMELIALCQFNATVILIMLFQSSPSQVLTMSLIFSVLYNCSAVHHRGSTPKCRLNQNKCNNFALSSGLSLW